jgi:hypothetical protein
MKKLFGIALLAFAGVAISQGAYKNPVDGKIYIADWKTYQPKGDGVAHKGRVMNAGVRLLNSQDDFEQNTTAQELAKLIGYIQENLTKQAEISSEGGEVLLQITLSKETRPQFKMSFQGSLKQELLQRFYDSLSAIDLKTKKDTVTLQVHFVVKNA